MSEAPPVPEPETRVPEEESLHAEVVAPSTRRRTLILATGTGVLGICIGALACVFLLPPRVRAITITPPAQRVVEQVPVVIERAAPPPISDVQLVFTAGDQTYMELPAPLATDLPKHARPELSQDGDLMVAVAEVSGKNLPSELAGWKRRTVVVDGTCEAHVTGFAIIGRLTGLARDASDELTEWTAENVLEYGNARLAARIDGCTGTFARDASLPAITVLADTNAPGDLAERAMDRFVAEDLVVRAQDDWKKAGNDGTWYEASDARVETHVMRHPRTGVVWVVVYAYRYNDCGQAGGDVVALYRVDADDKLSPVKVRVGGMERIEHVIDLEDDGELELVSASTRGAWIDRTNGDSVTSLGVASYGCGC